jgi:hypothetical protein
MTAAVRLDELNDSSTVKSGCGVYTRSARGSAWYWGAMIWEGVRVRGDADPQGSRSTCHGLI